MRPKILFVSNTAWNLYKFRLPLIKFLEDRGCDVLCVASKDDFAKNLKKFINVKIDRKSLNPLKDLLLFYNLYKIYKREKPDLILHWTIKPNIYGTIAAYLAKVKSINTVSGLGYTFTKKGILQKIIQILYRIAFKFSSKVIFQNENDYKLFLDKKIVASDKATIIRGSGVDTKFFTPKIKRNKKNENFLFMLISRMLWDKGIKEFIQSARIIKRKYPKVKFYLIGPIDEGNPSSIPKEIIDEWVKEKVVKYLGFKNDIRKYISKADVIVLPSYMEGVPNILLEASAMEKPIITTDAPGCKDVVENNKTGLLVKPKDIKSLIVAMEKMINISKKEREKMGKLGREKVKKEFSVEIVIKNYLNVINQVLGYDTNI